MIRIIVGIAAALAMSACTTVSPQKSITLAGGDVVARAPAGFCVDDRASRPSADFAVIAPCATLGADQALPSAVALATIQVGADGSGTVTGSETNMRNFLQSEAGAVLLSNVGDSSTVSDVSTQISDGRVTVAFNDSAPHSVGGLQNKEWRTFTDVNGRLVTVALRGLSAAPLDDSTGIWLLNAMAVGIAPAILIQATQSSDI
ncbi:dihydroxy-acid dehydratase [Yoonia maritima]|uniref:dihydroxy-acid dehydratase n=1 Tax=Yoonia maritima TaxID=1435347 RepID=UPI000D10575F|nr:dihydroxy-acid dehydratase [Yoonia maritima]